jgi:hypothetical protein
LKPRPRGRSSPVCSVRRQLPGRRTSLCRRDRPRVRERAEAGSRVASRNSGEQASGLPRIEWAGVSPDDGSEDPRPVRQGSSAGNVAPEGRDRVGRWLLSTQIVIKYNWEPLLAPDLAGGSKSPGQSKAVQLPRLIPFLKHPHSTEGYPSWQLRTKDENRGTFSLAHSPIFQRVRPCWGFPWLAC